MFFSIIIILILILSFMFGYRNGLILELFRMTSYLISFFITLILEKNVNQFIDDNILKNGTNKLFIHGLVFLIILILVHLIIIRIGALLNLLSHIPIIHKLNQIGGGVISFLISYFILLLILLIGLQLHNPTIQNQYNQSNVAQFVVNQTPIISSRIFNKFIEV